MSGEGLNLDDAGRGAPPTTAPAAPAPAGDLSTADLGALIGAAIANAQPKDEEKVLPIEDWLKSTFGGDLGRRDTQETVPMTGLGARGGSTMGDVLGAVSSLSAAQLTYLQRRLFQAGFYADEVYGNASVIQWGQLDAATVAALQVAFTQAGTNQVSDFDAFLDDQAARFRRTGVTAAGTSLDPGGAAGAAETVTIELEDPDSIRVLAEAAGIELLGRKPTEEELAKVTATIHGLQRDRARAKAQAEASGQDLPDLSDEAALISGGELNVPIDYDPDKSGIQRLTPEQYEVARTIIVVGQEMGLSEEYIVGALSAGIVESGLRNVNFGDRDSLGVFQQRNHYGSPEKRLDVRTAATMFYQEMLRSRGETLGEWVANTQRPAKQFRGRYSEKMNDAARIFSLVTGGPTSRPVNPRQADLGAELHRRSITDTPAPRVQGRGPGAMFRGEERKSSRATDLPPVIGSTGGGTTENPFWLDRYASVGNSQQDPIYNEIMGVDVGASIAEELKRLDPVGYSTRQTAAKAYEFFALLGAGGGAI